MVCIISAGVLVVPAFARNIPVLNSIIQSFNDKNGEYQKYSQAVNNSATDKGITLTINEVLCDNNQLIMAYTTKSDGNIKDVIKEKMDKDYRPFFLGHYLKINDKDGFGNGGDGGKYLDNHTYVGSCEINVSDKNLLENVNVDLNIKDIGGIKGNWKISFSYSKVEGLAPLTQASSLFIKDKDTENNYVEYKNKSDLINIGNRRKDENKPNEYVVEFEPLDKNKKYKIGTNDLEMYEIRNDLKFRIDLSNK